MELKESVIKKIQMAISLYELGKDNFKISMDVKSKAVGIILLQDAVEIFLSAICEHLNLEMSGQENFYKYIDKIEKAKEYPLPLKKQMIILNKQRVNIKHFCILPDIEECKYFDNDVKLFFSELSLRFLNKDIDSISLVDLIDNKNLRRYLKKAESGLEKCRYKDCQINCRKALYMIFEEPYDIRYVEEESNLDVLFSFHQDKRGYQEEIDKKVFNPIDFIEVDQKKIKNELIEMGIEYLTFKNLMILTPKMYYYKEKNKWVIMEDFLNIREYNRENAYYCLKNSVNIILKIQRYKNKAKWSREGGSVKAISGIQANVYKKASKKSNIEHILKSTLEYSFLIEFKIKSLDDDSYFYSIAGDESSKGFGYLGISGYLCEDDLSKEFIKKFNSSTN
ncbi:MAG: hypothetical protein KAV97_01240 [Actinomycetia bacterium]|nr:hypothetical protein [Actinomycetes bacterium]